MSTKNIWRAKMLASRAELGPDKISQYNLAICKNLSFVWVEGGGLGKPDQKPLWAGYKSYRWEADPQPAVLDSAPYLRWAYPRILPDMAMEFHEPAATDARWTKNSYGIWEPDPLTARKINLEDCVGILVPGVAFDRQGHRLGYGKGFYDRALAEFKGLKVGVGFATQMTSEALPFDGNDVTMDLIVTDREIIRVRPVRH
jgi:5-formyltetrahydrofolate cyclo-ligase